MPRRRRDPATPACDDDDRTYDDEMMDDEMLPAGILDAVVKVFTTHVEPNYSLPWQMRHQTSSSGTGFVIDKQRILTNAHCVDNYAVVKVKTRGGSMKYVAEVLAIGRECDLALLTVREPDFWRGMRPIELGPLPALQESVTVVGFPVGGDNLSITQGVVSRVDMQDYVHGCSELLAVQIDAAINPGNSGGPAFSAAQVCVGVAFQSLKDGSTENIGRAAPSTSAPRRARRRPPPVRTPRWRTPLPRYVIPMEVVRHFLEDVRRHGRYLGFCELGVELQRRARTMHGRSDC